jgi:hypothetical protein
MSLKVEYNADSFSFGRRSSLSALTDPCIQWLGLALRERMVLRDGRQFAFLLLFAAVRPSGCSCRDPCTLSPEISYAAIADAPCRKGHVPCDEEPANCTFMSLE